MIPLSILLTIGPYSPPAEMPGKGSNGPEEPMKIERDDYVNVTCELVEEIVRAITGQPIKKEKEDAKCQRNNEK